MAIRSKVVLLLTALLLGACGGGGGGGETPPSSTPPPATPPPAPPPPTPPPPTPLALTESNAADAARSALGGSEAVVAAATRIREIGLFLLFSGQGEFRIHCGLPPFALGTGRHIDNDVSGSLSVGDRITFDSPACAGVTTSIQATVRSINAQGFEALVSFDLSRDNPATRAVGSVTLASEFTAAAITNGSVDFTIGGFTEKLTLARSDYTVDTFDYVVSLEGTVDSDQFDAPFSFKTESPFGGYLGSFPTSGELLLTGGTTRALFRAPTGGGVGRTGDYRVDPTGAGYGAARTIDWTTLLSGTMFGVLPGDTPSITRLEFDPAAPTASDTITASYDVVDPNGNSPLFYEFRWRINGVDLHGGSSPVSQLYPNPPGLYRRGDVVEFRLRANDARSWATATRSVTIANAPPVFTGPVTFSPAAPNTTHAITAVADATDVDEDAVTYSYAWRRNGVLLAGRTSSVLPADEHARGDVIDAVVTASDGLTTSTSEASVTIGDAPPMVSAVAPPASVSYGMPLTFDTNVADPDGDPVGGLLFRLAYGPAGMTVNSTTGEVSWQPGGPMFDKTVDVHWGVTVAAPVAVPATGTISVNDPGRRYPLMHAGFSYALRPSAVQVGDFDGDDDEEVLVAGGRGFYEVEHDGAQGYRQSWMYPFAFGDRDDPYLEPDIDAFTTGDIDNDGRHEIFVAGRGYVARLDGVERRVVATVSTGEFVTCTNLRYGDLDRDGAAEIVCVTETVFHQPSNKILVLRAADLSTIWEAPESTYGYSVAIGNVDDDGALEIVAAGGYVIDGASFATQWVYTPPGVNYDMGFGFDVHTADLDDDGVDEIVAAFDWAAPIRVYDARAQTMLWQFEDANRDLGALRVGDLDGDGTPEIVVGNEQYGALTAYRIVGDSAEVIFRLDGQNSVHGIGIGDLDDDGAAEIFWSTFHEPLLQVASALGTIEWDSGAETLWGPYFGGELAGSPLEPRAPLFAVQRTAGFPGGGRLLSMDPVSGDLTPSGDLGSHANGGAALVVSDYDADGTDEAIVTAGEGYDSRLVAYDPFVEQEEWATPLTSEQSAYAVALAKADLSGDGHDDIVAISASGRVEAYDMNDETLIWRGPYLGEGRDVAVGDLDNDGVLDIVALNWREIHVFERAGPGNYVETASVQYTEWEPRRAEIADTDGSGGAELIVLAAAWSYPATGSRVQRLDASLNVLSSFEVPWRGYALAVEPSPTPRKNLIVPTGYDGGGGGASRVAALDAVTGDIVWRSPLLRGVPVSNSLNFVTLPGETQQRMTIGNHFGAYLTR